MSTLNSVQPRDTAVTVMARSADGKPVKLRAGSEHSGYVEVIGFDSSKSINFPAGDVYRLDESPYEKLASAYEANQEETLQNLWAEAIPFTSP